ncbi:hypothetical protein HY418_01200 [Candidatus Kaiserbacteria bacterium]|nr:hypothetical protein [Candidatus Kaiserbacteria bacterium]
MPTTIRFTTILVVAAALALAVAARAEAQENCLSWTIPGSNVNQMTLRDTVKILTKDLPAIEEATYKKYRKTVVLMEDVDAVLRDSGLPKAEQERARAQFTRSKKQFWGPGGLEKLAIPAEFRQTLMVRYIDLKAFTPTVMRRGDRIEGFIFERREVPCAIYAPAPGQPEEIVINEIEVLIPNTPDVLVVRHSEACSNAGKTRRPARQTALRAVAAPMPQSWFKNVVGWLWLPSELANQLGLSDVLKRTHGKNSRSLGASFFVGGDSSRPIPPRYEKGDVTVEFIFRDVNYVAGRGRTVLVNDIPALIPGDFSAEKPGLPVPATKAGTATLSLGHDSKEWVTAQSVLETSFESFRDRVSYPDPARTLTKRAMLATCAKSASELSRCGRPWTEETGELYRWLQKEGDNEFRIHMRMK